MISLHRFDEHGQVRAISLREFIDALSRLEGFHVNGSQVAVGDRHSDEGMTTLLNMPRWVQYELNELSIEWQYELEALGYDNEHDNRSEFEDPAVLHRIDQLDRFPRLNDLPDSVLQREIVPTVFHELSLRRAVFVQRVLVELSACLLGVVGQSPLPIDAGVDDAIREPEANGPMVRVDQDHSIAEYRLSDPSLPHGFGNVFSSSRWGAHLLADKRVATGIWGNSLCIWDPHGRQPTEYFPGEGHPVSNVVQVRSGELLTHRYASQELVLVDPETGASEVVFAGVDHAGPELTLLSSGHVVTRTMTGIVVLDPTTFEVVEALNHVDSPFVVGSTGHVYFNRGAELVRWNPIVAGAPEPLGEAMHNGRQSGSVFVAWSAGAGGTSVRCFDEIAVDRPPTVLAYKALPSQVIHTGELLVIRDTRDVCWFDAKTMEEIRSVPVDPSATMLLRSSGELAIASNQRLELHSTWDPDAATYLEGGPAGDVSVMFEIDDATLVVKLHEGPLIAWNIDKSTPYAEKPRRSGAAVYSSGDRSIVASGRFRYRHELRPKRAPAVGEAEQHVRKGRELWFVDGGRDQRPQILTASEAVAVSQSGLFSAAVLDQTLWVWRGGLANRFHHAIDSPLSHELTDSQIAIDDEGTVFLVVDGSVHFYEPGRTGTLDTSEVGYVTAVVDVSGRELIAIASNELVSWPVYDGPGIRRLARVSALLADHAWGIRGELIVATASPAGHVEPHGDLAVIRRFGDELNVATLHFPENRPHRLVPVADGVVHVSLSGFGSVTVDVARM